MKIDKSYIGLIISAILLIILIAVPLIYVDKFKPKDEFIHKNKYVNKNTIEFTLKQSQTYRDSLVKQSKLILNKNN